jgi:hypothetical protein
MSFKLLQLLQDDEAGDQEGAASTSRFVRMRAQTHTAAASLSEEMSKAAPKEEKRGNLL